MSHAIPIDPIDYNYEEWKDRTLANRQRVGMIPSEVEMRAEGFYDDEQYNEWGGIPWFLNQNDRIGAYQPLHERTETKYVSPGLAGTATYDKYGDRWFKGGNIPTIPDFLSSQYPFEPDYAALHAGNEYMERTGGKIYDSTQSQIQRMTDDPDYRESLGHYSTDLDRIFLNMGLIRGAGPEMIEGSGIDRFGHEQRQEWDAPGRWDINEPHWRNLADEVTRHELKHSLEKEFGKNVPYPVEEAINPMSGKMENYPHLGWGDVALHREIYTGDPIWSKGQNWRGDIHAQGFPATFREGENVMAMHNWAKDQYLGSQPAERPNMRDVAGPVRREPVVQEREVRGRGPSRAQQRLNTGSGEGPPGYNYNTGGLASLML